MRRLTWKVDSCFAVCPMEDCREECSYWTKNSVRKCRQAQMYDKLAAYEDIGLEPHEIVSLFPEGKIPKPLEISAAKRIYEGKWVGISDGKTDI